MRPDGWVLESVGDESSAAASQSNRGGLLFSKPDPMVILPANRILILNNQ